LHVNSNKAGREPRPFSCPLISSKPLDPDAQSRIFHLLQELLMKVKCYIVLISRKAYLSVLSQRDTGLLYRPGYLFDKMPCRSVGMNFSSRGLGNIPKMNKKNLKT
jgi:hypothetical protein